MELSHVENVLLCKHRNFTNSLCFFYLIYFIREICEIHSKSVGANVRGFSLKVLRIKIRLCPKKCDFTATNFNNSFLTKNWLLSNRLLVYFVFVELVSNHCWVINIKFLKESYTRSIQCSSHCSKSIVDRETMDEKLNWKRRAFSSCLPIFMFIFFTYLTSLN